MNKHRWLVVLFVLFAATYFWQILDIPPDQAALARYQLSYRAAQLFRLSVAVPVVLVWAIGLYGYFKLDTYALLLRKTKEYPIWRNIAHGLLIMVCYLPFISIYSNWSSSVSYNDPSLAPRMIIIQNYVVVALLLASAMFIYKGTRLLFNSPQVKSKNWAHGAFYLLVFLVVGALFVFINLSNPARQFPTESVKTAAYYLPDWLLVTTILVPYMGIWYAGVKSVEHIHAYSSAVRGSIYKRALRYLAVGLATVVLSLIMIRFLAATTTILDKSGLKVLLMVVYGLVFLMAIGYVLISRGAHRLAKIEEA